MEHLLEVKDLHISFKNRKRQLPVVDDLNLSIRPGETFCIVGESGSGKTVTALSIMGLLGASGSVQGQILFAGQDLTAMSEAERNQLRGGQLSMIFQDALRALNPVFTIGNQLIEAIRLHSVTDREKAHAHALYMLDRVGIPDPKATMKKYPHTLSGGMRQRVLIAMALACRPKLLIADEPTTALDVTIQAQIVRLLKEFQQELGMSILLITHDIGLVAEIADRVAVMYAGQIVELAEVHRLFHCPRHPYTQALLRSVPSIYWKGERLSSIPGSVPEHYVQNERCRFLGRCPYGDETCGVQQLKSEDGEHWVRCHKAQACAPRKDEVSLRACV